ncbi:UDP-N-acetyl-D-glucosamine dehydrogenase [Planctomycetales bacterium 10988]|nr:UDP-N-acetyl-D-glucosamine dehydrogenase [Planctomycetales bacterium 10988]
MRIRTFLPAETPISTTLRSEPFQKLAQSIEDRTACVGVMGLGYVGLPLIHAFASAGHPTLGFDVDERKIEQLTAGKSYIGHLPDEMLTEMLDSKLFEPTSEMNRLEEADIILICVPTPLSESRDPDLRYVESTAEEIAKRLRPGQMIVLESTTYPGTTKDCVLPILEQSGLKVGEDFFLAYSPEREDPGNKDYTASRIPKVVGGHDEASATLAEAIYKNAVVDVIKVSSCEIAEACKILENTYRAVNIALVNELKMLYDRMGIDIWEVIDAAKTKPFGFQAFYPGPGLGGHCIPIDPFYLTWVARKNGCSTRFIELAGEINTSMPKYVISKAMEGLNHQGKAIRNSKICLLGVAYKKDVDDPRESPSFVLIDELLHFGADLSYSDPFVPKLPSMRNHNVPDLASEDLTPEFLASQDCVIIATDHTEVDYEMVVQYAPLVIDTRNATAKINLPKENVIKA